MGCGEASLLGLHGSSLTWVMVRLRSLACKLPLFCYILTWPFLWALSWRERRVSISSFLLRTRLVLDLGISLLFISLPIWLVAFERPVSSSSYCEGFHLCIGIDEGWNTGSDAVLPDQFTFLLNGFITCGPWGHEPIYGGLPWLSTKSMSVFSC